MRKFVPTHYNHVILGGPPTDWNELVVMRVETRELMNGLVEVNVEQGWVRQIPQIIPLNCEIPEPIKITGKFLIYRVVDIDETIHINKDET